MNLRRPCAACAVLVATVLAGCARPHRYFQPTPDQIGPLPNSYGEVVAPRRGLIAVQGDELAYGLARGRSQRRINGADQGQGPLTISEALRKVIRGMKVENRGFPGDTVAASAARWAGAPRADLLILAYGFGDEQAHTPLDTYVNGLSSMVQTALQSGEAVFVIVPPDAADPLLQSDLRPYQDGDRAVAAAPGATVFETDAAIIRLKAPLSKSFAQTPAVYQAVAADMAPYIKVVAPPAP